MKSSQKKKRLRLFFRLQAGCFILLLGGLALVNVLTPARTVSEKEKRTLATFPTLNAGTLTDGSFSTDFETYASDQMVARDFFVNLHGAFSLLMGQNYSQGVFKAKDGYLIAPMEEVDEDVLNTTLTAICNFRKQTGIPSALVLVPNAVSIYPELLPAHAITQDQSLWMDYIGETVSGDVTFLDLTFSLTALKATGAQVYYRTDHHWTTEAAVSCLPTVAEVLGITPSTTYALAPVCDTFSGSLAAKSGFPVRTYDCIDIPIPETDTPYLVTDNTTHTKSTSLYSTEALSGTDPYTVFLGGNSAHITIQTTNTDGPSLLIFKDSYLNCFLPLLVSEYARIDVIDPRYYYEDLQLLLYEQDYDAVLYFYNLNTFAADTSLSLVLGDAL
jgi:hypothetical protein